MGKPLWYTPVLKDTEFQVASVLQTPLFWGGISKIARLFPYAGHSLLPSVYHGWEIREPAMGI